MKNSRRKTPRIHENTGKLEAKVTELARVSRTTLVGQKLILDAEAKKTKVGKVLSKTFGDANAARIMARTIRTRNTDTIVIGRIWSR